MKPDPFADYRQPQEPTGEAFVKLNELVRKLNERASEVEEAETALKAAQERHRDIEQFQLPQLMEEMGLSEFVTSEGFKITIKTKIRASIGNRKAAAFKWLIEHGHAGLIKNIVSVAFGKGQEQEAHAFQQSVAEKHGDNVKRDMKVEAATLTAFVTEQLEAGEPIPEDTFGVMRQTFAKISQQQE